MDYYDRLGVSRTASPKEIKTAFRKLAAKHHPDKGGDSKTFQEINEAYQVLHDQEKRAMYDQYGTVDPQQTGFSQQGFGDFQDIFSQMFGQDASPFGDVFGQRRQKRQPRNKNLNINYEITLEEAYFGKQIFLEIPLPSGTKKTINTKIPRGIDNGQQIRLQGMGDDSLKHIQPGDMTVTIRVQKDNNFKREGCDLYKDLTISVYDLILGTKIKIKHFDKDFMLTIPAGTQPGTVMRVAEHGMPILNAPGIGTLFVTILGTVPKGINEHHKDLIERARILTNTRKDV